MSEPSRKELNDRLLYLEGRVDGHAAVLAQRGRRSFDFQIDAAPGSGRPAPKTKLEAGARIFVDSMTASNKSQALHSLERASTNGGLSSDAMVALREELRSRKFA